MRQSNRWQEKRQRRRALNRMPGPEVEYPIVVLTLLLLCFGPGSAFAATELSQYEGRPVSEWLKAVATEIPKQRVKENHKSPHKGGAGFLRRFALEGLLAWRTE